MSGIDGISQIDSVTGVAMAQKSSNSSAWGLPIIYVPNATQMITVAGPTAIGANQITECVAPSSNANGLRLLSFYTQVIQASLPGNIAQTLVIAALTAPVDFSNKVNCFPLYRTFQDEKQTASALGGFAPVNVFQIDIPAGWGIWQIASITGAVLSRNNMRFGLSFN